MARPEDVSRNGSYKIWKTWHEGDYYHSFIPPQISPMPNSEIKLSDVMIVNIIDDIGVYGGGITMVYYLYDFIKTGRKKVKKQTIIRKKKGYISDVFYDYSLEEKLGGQKEILGGGL